MFNELHNVFVHALVSNEATSDLFFPKTIYENYQHFWVYNVFVWFAEIIITFFVGNIY